MAPPRRENSTVDALVEELRREITEGPLGPGQRIDLDAWGERMGASRTPVRLALERLETEGFIKLAGRRGASIIDVTLTHIEDVLATRVTLDAALGRAGARKVGPEDLDVLRSLLAEIEAVQLPEQHALMVDPTSRFHRYLFQAAGAPMLYRLAMQAVHHTHVFLNQMWYTNRRIAYVGKAYFAELFGACGGHDLDRVERLIRDHRIDMAGVILQDRIRTDELEILPGVLTGAELQRLRSIVDDGRDPTGPVFAPPAPALPIPRGA
jgi:DNA-binding GntR family transcriptional regulator